MKKKKANKKVIPITKGLVKWEIMMMLERILLLLDYMEEKKL